MWNRGSITVFYSLILTLVLSLVGSFLLLAKVSAGRAQIAMAMDMAMYSEMAKYDPLLLEKYHVFFLDGGYGTQTLKLGNILDEVQEEITYGLSPSKGKGLLRAIDFIDLKAEKSAITGYSLATDQKGGVFRTQAVQYMKHTKVLQGISSLNESFWGEKMGVFGDLIHAAGFLDGRFADTGGEDGTNIWNTLNELSETLSIERLEELPYEETKTEAGEPVLEIDKEKVREAKKVLTEVSRLKRSSILHKLIQTPEALSDWCVYEKELVSNRRCQSGMGIVDIKGQVQDTEDSYYFQAYLMQNMNHYRQQVHTTGPAYAIEYILSGKTSDVENLESTAKSLLFIRQVENTVYLYTDVQKRAGVESVSATAAMLLGLPDLKEAIKAALILSWAYVESLVDVRGLLSGKNVPLWKNSTSWQVEPQDILLAISDPDSCTKDNGSVGYEEYLALMLLTVSEEEKTMRCLDVVEQTMRALPQRSGYSMDCAVGMLEVQMHIRVEDKKTFEITNRKSYDCM